MKKSNQLDENYKEKFKIFLIPHFATHVNQQIVSILILPLTLNNYMKSTIRPSKFQPFCYWICFQLII